MVQYQIKQKFWSLGGKFKIMDNAGNLAYYVQGSFMKIPKQFTITKPDGAQVSRIKKVLFQIFRGSARNLQQRAVAGQTRLCPGTG